jgi:hypothetical protein
MALDVYALTRFRANAGYAHTHTHKDKPTYTHRVAIQSQQHMLE